MNNFKRMFLSAAVCGLIAFCGVNAARLPKNTYKGKVLTEKNLKKLAPKTPTYLKSLAIECYKNKRQRSIIEHGANFIFEKEKVKVGEINGNIGNSNIVRPFTDEFVEKVSGYGNRLSLQIAAQNLPYGDFKKLDKKNMLKETYQTASRMFYHMRILDVIESCKLKYVTRPDSYLVDVTGGDSIDDKKTAFYERTLGKDFQPLKNFLTNKETLEEAVPLEAFQELLVVIKAVGLWDFTGRNTFVDKKTKTIVILDAEQPNTIKPSQLFNKDWNLTNLRKSRYGFNTVAGLHSLYDQIKKAKAKNYLLVIKKFVEKDLALKKAGNYERELLKRFKDDGLYKK